MRAIERQSLLVILRFHTRERVNIPCLESSSKPTFPETDVITRATSTWCFLARFLSLPEYLASILLAFFEREVLRCTLLLFSNVEMWTEAKREVSILTQPVSGEWPSKERRLKSHATCGFPSI